ncbi:hypothetical protein [Streptococcus dysgalactiae]|uniref:Phage protein n=1 Tax=Streptococcus dysgalactiae subsp. equisimilis TaxID=119602 RepID=A0AAE9U5Q0_STREQ|nr:hypothetical protein [Streptococcus dysgalactiae]VTT16020.1 phage protein [Streptococcus dysgalactiae]VTT25740.1 phage protein [Streptococcus dysgalactiae subsp. equisimilis]
MNKREIKNLVDRLSDLIDKCDNDFEEMALNPDAIFDLLLESHSALYRLLYGDGMIEEQLGVLLDKEGSAYVKVVFDDGDFWTVRNPFNGMLLTSKEAERFPQFTWVPLTDL